MAFSITWSCRLTAAVNLLLIAAMGPGAAQQPAQQATAASSRLEPLDTSLSPECRVPGSLLYTLGPLRSVQAALDEKRPIRVLALGSSGSSGLAASYALRLEGDLERILGAGIDVEVEERALPGEIMVEAVDTITRHIDEVDPDLVVWQAGTNDALARADLDDFGRALDDVLAWLSEHQIDVLLVEPPYSPALRDDEHYRGLIARIQQAARRSGVPLVLRYEALRYLAQQAAAGKRGRGALSAFGVNDLGARCIAEHVTRTVALSLLLGPGAAAPSPEAGTAPSGNEIR